MQTISETIHQLELGQAETFEGLTVFPLLARASRAADYRTLDEALERDDAHVREVSESGEVPNLLFENNGDQKVLLVDGDELVGAKQNRIINLSILVAAHSKIEIPVSCVEVGRWAYRRREFGSKHRSMYARARAAKSVQVTAHLKRAGRRYANQNAVWADIAECSLDLGVDSRTGAMEDIYRQHDARLAGYREAFQAQEGQVGAVFAVNGRVEGIEYFDSPQPFQKYLGRLVCSYAVGAMLEPCTGAAVASDEAVKDFLEQVANAETESYSALGIGEDLRLSAGALAGGALVAEDRVVHLAAFRRNMPGGPASAPLRRFRNGNLPVH